MRRHSTLADLGRFRNVIFVSVVAATETGAGPVASLTN
jgi:hypothetical protein